MGIPIPVPVPDVEINFQNDILNEKQIEAIQDISKRLDKIDGNLQSLHTISGHLKYVEDTAYFTQQIDNKIYLVMVLICFYIVCKFLYSFIRRFVV